MSRTHRMRSTGMLVLLAVAGCGPAVSTTGDVNSGSGGTKTMFVPLPNGSVMTVPVAFGAKKPNVETRESAFENMSDRRLSNDRPSRHGTNRTLADQGVTVRWYKPPAPNWRGQSDCSLGSKVYNIELCPIAKPIQHQYNVTQSLYAETPGVGIDGKLFCGLGICEFGGGHNVIFDSNVFDNNYNCRNIVIYTASRGKSISIVKVFCFASPTDVEVFEFAIK